MINKVRLGYGVASNLDKNGLFEETAFKPALATLQFRTHAEVGWDLGKGLEGFRKREQPARSQVAGMSLMCFMNEKEARVQSGRKGKSFSK